MLWLSLAYELVLEVVHYAAKGVGGSFAVILSVLFTSAEKQTLSIVGER